MLLIIVTVVLAFELVAWAAQKIRRCTHEIMDDADTQVLNSLPVRANRADDSHVRDPEGRGRHLHGSSAEPANEIFSGEQVQLEISPPSR